MGKSKSTDALHRIDDALIGLYTLIPTTYYGILHSILNPFINNHKRYTVLDLACGDGYTTQKMLLPKKFIIDGVELHKPYAQIARNRGIYRKVYSHDIRTFLKKQKYDIIIASHVIEHLSKSEGRKLMETMLKHANEMVIIATPIGELPQDTYDNNRLQIHKSQWFVPDFTKKGFKVRSQGVKFIWGNGNVILNWGIFSYFFFFLSTLLSPLLIFKPELGTYMICYCDK